MQDWHIYTNSLEYLNVLCEIQVADIFRFWMQQQILFPKSLDVSVRCCSLALTAVMTNRSVGSGLLIAWGHVYDFSSPVLLPAFSPCGNMMPLYKYVLCCLPLHCGALPLAHRSVHLKLLFIVDVRTHGPEERCIYWELLPTLPVDFMNTRLCFMAPYFTQGISF
jgi:hypothetical protein